MAIINPVIYGSGGMAPYLVVSAEEGSLVTAVNGDITINAPVGESGAAKVKLTKFGDWVVTVTTDGKVSVPQTVTVLEEYLMEARFHYDLVKSPKLLSLVSTRSNLAAATVGDYALFGGGISGSSIYSSKVDAYNQELTRTTPTSLSQERSNLAATTVGDYALFGGGYNGVYYKNIVDAYDRKLTRTFSTTLSQERCVLAATTVGDYALFGGGRSGGSSYYSTVDAYDQELTRTTPTELSQARETLAATNVGDYALFGGGRSDGSGYYSTVDAYDRELTRTTPTELSEARYSLAAATVGNYALFGGGYGRTYSNIVDVYTLQ